MARVFTPYRAVGLITSDVPFSFLYSTVGQKEKTTILTAVGNTYHEYGADRLNLKTIGPSLEKEVQVVLRLSRYICAAVGSKIYVFKGGVVQQILEHSRIGKVTHLLGHDEVLISIGSNNSLAVWAIKGALKYNELVFPPGSNCSAVCIPHNYKNKVLVATQQGHALLYNIRTGNLFHKFEGWGSPITSMCASQVTDIVAFGLENGKVIIHNIAYDETVITYKHSSESAITALSFRMDGPQMLASGTAEGEIAVWNLESKELEGLLSANIAVDTAEINPSNPHRGKILTLQFAPREPLLFTSGSDNSIKTYFFGNVGVARLLKHRSGHFKPVSCVRFLSPKFMCTTAQDRTLRVQHVFLDQLNTEITQGENRGLAAARKSMNDRFNLLLPPVTSIAYNPRRENSEGIPTMLTTHEGSLTVFPWSVGHKFNILDWTLVPKKRHDLQKETSTAVAISHCGLFGFVGLSNGIVNIYSLHATVKAQTKQSASTADRFRAEVVDNSTSAKSAHVGAVRGLQVNTFNDRLITCSEDEHIKIWDISKCNKGTVPLMRTLYTGYKILSAVYSKDNEHLLVCNDDHSVRIYDVDLNHQRRDWKKMTNQDAIEKRMAEGKLLVCPPVRHFRGHTEDVTTMAFTPDHSMVVTASKDHTMRIYHMATNSVVDIYRFEHHVTDMSFEPNGHFLATTHADSNHTALWTNNLKYGLVPTVVKDEEELMSRPLSSMPITTLDEANPLASTAEKDLDLLEHKAEAMEVTLRLRQSDEAYVSIDTLLKDKDVNIREAKPGMVTFSDTSRPKWAALPNLDLIKSRNKPTLPPKEYKAPFFLPTNAGLQPKFVMPEEGLEEVTGDHIRMEQDGPPAKKAKIAEAEDDEELEEDSDAEVSKTFISSDLLMQSNTEFMTLLSQKQYAEALALLLEMSPSAIEFEFREVAEDSQIEWVLDFMDHCIKERTCYEAIQACLSVVLKLHGDAIVKSPTLCAKMETINKNHEASWKGIQHLVQYNLCVLKLLTKQS